MEQNKIYASSVWEALLPILVVRALSVGLLVFWLSHRYWHNCYAAAATATAWRIMGLSK